MHERLSFYLQRDSPLHRLNPLTKLVLAITLIILSFSLPFILLPSMIYLFVLVPLSYWGKVGKEFVTISIRLLLPLFGFLFVMQSLFYPGGETVLFIFGIFSVKLEGVIFAFQTATRILVMVSSFLLLLLSTHPSTLMNDLARRGVPPALSYIITATLQIIPVMRAKANTILDAQRSRGLDTHGNIIKRTKSLLPLVGPLVFGSLVDVEERAIAIEARGFNLPGRKTSLIEIQDSPAQARLRWLLLVVMLLAIGGRFWLS
jgi:energy-coupling factor transport system permease protein